MTAKEYFNQEEITASGYDTQMRKLSYTKNQLISFADEYATHKLSTIKAMIQDELKYRQALDPMLKYEAIKNIGAIEAIKSILNQIEK